MKRKNPVNEIVVLSNPRRRGKVRRRRNPIFGGSLVGNFVSMLKEGAMGAVGALANDAAFGFAKQWLPAQLQAGYGRTGVKLVSAAVLGFLANKVLPGKGRALAVGAATVTVHEALTGLANQFAPSLPLGAYEDNGMLGCDSAAIVGQGTGQYMGAYINKKESVGDLLTP